MRDFKKPSELPILVEKNSSTWQGGISLNCHELSRRSHLTSRCSFQLHMVCGSDIFGSHITRTSVGFLSSHWPIPSGAVDLCMHSLFKYSLTWSTSTKRNLPCSGFSLRLQDQWFQYWAREFIVFLGLFPAPCHQVPFPSLSRFSPRRALVFPTPSLQVVTVPWWSCWIPCSCSHLLDASKTHQKTARLRMQEWSVFIQLHKLLLAWNTPFWLSALTNWIYFSNTWPSAKRDNP